METSRHENASDRIRTIPAIMPEVFVRNWQLTGLKMLRAQERMLYGMMSAARLEMQFGQDLILNRIARYNSRSENGATRGDGAFQEFERMITMVREVTEELRTGFSEATKLMTEDADELVQEAVKRGPAQGVADKTAEVAQETGQIGARLAKKMNETADDTASTAAKAAEQTDSTDKDTRKSA